MGGASGGACLVGSSSGEVTQLWSQQLLHKHVGKQCKKEGTTQISQCFRHIEEPPWMGFYSVAQHITHQGLRAGGRGVKLLYKYGNKDLLPQDPGEQCRGFFPYLLLGPASRLERRAESLASPRDEA